MRTFDITCFKASEPKRTLIVNVLARDVDDAFEKVRAMGYEPVCW